MLVLSRRVNEKIYLDQDNIRITLVVTKIRNGSVEIGFNAPSSVSITRDDCRSDIPKKGKSFN